MKRLTAIATLLLALSACGERHDYSSEIEQNEQLIAKLTEQVSALQGIDEEPINNLRESRFIMLSLLESSLARRGDTLDSALAATMLSFTTDGAPYHPFAVERDPAVIRLERSSSQLLALNHDLVHNLLPQDSVSYLLQAERLSAKDALVDAQRIQEIKMREEAKSQAWLMRMDSFQTTIKP